MSEAMTSLAALRQIARCLLGPIGEAIEVATMELREDTLALGWRYAGSLHLRARLPPWGLLPLNSLPAIGIDTRKALTDRSRRARRMTTGMWRLATSGHGHRGVWLTQARRG